MSYTQSQGLQGLAAYVSSFYKGRRQGYDFQHFENTNQ